MATPGRPGPESTPPVGCAAPDGNPVHDDTYGPDDPYAGRTPWLRRPGVRILVTLIAVGSFLLATLVSSCGPRRTVPDPATTTTISTVQVENPGPLPDLLIGDA